MRSTLPSSRRRAWAWPYGAAVSHVAVWGSGELRGCTERGESYHSPHAGGRVRRGDRARRHAPGPHEQAVPPATAKAPGGTACWRITWPATGGTGTRRPPAHRRQGGAVCRRQRDARETSARHPQNTRSRRARAPADWRPARGHGGDSMPRRGVHTSARHAVVCAFARPADSGPGDGSRTGPVVSRRRSGAGQPFSRAASSIRRVTAPGWLTMTACEEWISSACALARFAKQRSFSGSMIWSFAAVR